ncbi:hypothetical protein FACS189434_06500 [Bacteroidia bacterium]|nr:hypothetical protein FACS189434_06500 [Bacteroidia bacterium]
MRKGINEELSEIRELIRDLGKIGFENFKIRIGIYKTDLLSRARCKQYHLLPIYAGISKSGLVKYKLTCIDRDGFDYYKRKGFLPKKIKWFDLRRKSFYSTVANRNNTLTQQQRADAIGKYNAFKEINLI